MTAPHDDLDQRVRVELAALSARVAAPESRAPSPDADLAAFDTDLAAQLTAFDADLAAQLTAFDAMAGSRHLDLAARRLRERGRGHYTIGSAGHESNAFVATALRVTDPALLHYRSGAFFLARSLQAGRPLADGLRDVLAGLVGATIDPASGGRHKVFGHPDLAIIPQTSTIASHLPGPSGVAFSIDRARRLGVPTRWPSDAVTVCSFGDAGANHSTAVGALNTAGYCVQTGLALPVLFVCEDNGLGISVPSPAGWVAQTLRRPGLGYAQASGHEPDQVRATAQRLVEEIRRTRRPAVLHLRTVRFMGHAGTDLETSYRSAAELRADLELDPLLALARQIDTARQIGTARRSDPRDPVVDLADRYAEIEDLVQRLADELVDERRPATVLTSRGEIMAPLAPRRAGAIVDEARRRAAPEHRLRVFGGKLPEQTDGLTLAQSINAALVDGLAARPEMLVFGEDVGRKGGVYGVTRGLAQRFRANRVFDTLLDEQAILGLALGAGTSGLLPVPEIQYLAYLHNAVDQLRGEAASLRFFSNATFTNPMVVRVAGLAYQKGFGGHFHNDNAVAALRDIPGIVLAVPSRPEDAGPMLRTLLAAGVTDGQVSVFLEPIALYHERDLYEVGDRGWLGAYDLDEHVPVRSARTHGEGTDLTIVTFGNGVRMSLRVARRLAADGIGARVVDLRWLAPLPVADIRRECEATGRVVVADETRHSGGVGEGVVTALVEGAFGGRIARVASADTYIPLGPAADLVLLGEDDIEQAARAILD